MTLANILRVSAVAAAAIAGAASATSQSNCPPGKPCGPQLKSAGLPSRAGAMRTETAVDGVSVQARQAGAAGWELAIKNETTSPVLMVWDESSFVMSNSQSAGRLLRGETRKIDSGKAQPPTPIPPGVVLSQYVIAEKLTNEDEVENDIAERDRIGFNDEMLANIKSRRALREKALNGGKLYLVIETGGEKKTWVGVVEVPAPAAAPAVPVDAGVEVDAQ